MQANGINDLLHYLDNYFMAGPAGTGNCQCNINMMVEVCREMRFAVNPSKVTSPSPLTSFLGISIDSHEGIAHIDPSVYKQSFKNYPVSVRLSWPQSTRSSP